MASVYYKTSSNFLDAAFSPTMVGFHGRTGGAWGESNIVYGRDGGIWKAGDPYVRHNNDWWRMKLMWDVATYRKEIDGEDTQYSYTYCSVPTFVDGSMTKGARVYQVTFSETAANANEDINTWYLAEAQGWDGNRPVPIAYIETESTINGNTRTVTTTDWTTGLGSYNLSPGTDIICRFAENPNLGSDNEYLQMQAQIWLVVYLE